MIEGTHEFPPTEEIFEGPGGGIVGPRFSTPHMQCKALCVHVCNSEYTCVCEREERGLSPKKAIFVNGKVLKYLQMDLRTLQNRTVSVQNSLEYLVSALVW